MLRSQFLCTMGLVCLMGCSADQTATPAPATEEEPQLAEIDEIVSFEDLNPELDVIEINLVAGYAQAELELGNLTDVMAYNGSTPGPLLYGTEGDRVIVHFVNQLDEPTTVHWHGLRISDQMDGADRVNDPVPPGGTFTFDFVLPEAGTYWYHPHFNAEQLARGLYGPIVVAEKEAPLFNHERLLVLDEVRLNDGFQLAPFGLGHHDFVHGRAGDRLLTNGKTFPASGTVTPGVIERWRLINAGNATALEVSLENATWKVIGTGGGLLPAPYTTDRLMVAPGQRYDLEVRVSDQPSSVVRLLSHVIPGVAAGTDATHRLAEYVVSGEAAPIDDPIYPTVTLPALAEGAEQEMKLSAHFVAGDNVVFTVNDKTGTDIADLVLQQGAPVRFKLVNEIGPHHAWHLQGQFFQVISRGGMPVNEPGLKDTVLVDALSEVEVLSYLENPGSWLYNCGIPAHAEHGMAGKVIVTPSP